jgi:predicted Fe-Mo cluster-binding NifX family protein
MKKIAFPSEDGQTISRHLGRAPFFIVATLQDGQLPTLERRPKPHHGSGHDHDEHEHSNEQGHAQPSPQAAPLHPDLQHAPPNPDTSISVSANPEGVHAMFSVIADCQVLVAGGMGEPAYQRAQAYGLEVYLTGEWKIEAALAAYQAGLLKSDLRRVHAH